MKIWQPALLAFALCIGSCGNKKQAESQQETITESQDMAEEKTDDAQAGFKAGNSLQIDPAMFQSAMMNTPAEGEPWVEGDLLHIPVKYAACNKHKDWMLVGSPMWMKSLPPQKPIRLLRGNIVEELCPANDGIRDTLVFDLKPGRYPGHDRVIFNLVGDRGFRIEYVYETE